MKMSISILVALLIFSVSTGAADTYLILPDGSGDYPTIQQAVDVAVDGDIIELGSGTFTGPGNRDIHILGPALTIRSQSADPASCTIDCEDAGWGFYFEEAAGGTTNLAGITITRGRADIGAAVWFDWQVDPAVTDCVFYRNAAHAGGGVAGPGGSGTFVHCRFVENSAETVGGAFIAGAMTGYYLHTTFEDCQFIGNTAGYSGGAIYLEALPLREGTFRNCSFIGNASLGTGGAITLLGMSPLIEHCTFTGNTAGSGGIIDCQGDVQFPASPVIRHSIIAFSGGGSAISCPAGWYPSLTCSDLYGNAGGDWVDCIADQAGHNGNLSSDPLFCDPANQDYTLWSDSPCAPDANPACGLVGAWPVGCGGPVPVRFTTWGALKAGFR